MIEAVRDQKASGRKGHRDDDQHFREPPPMDQTDEALRHLRREQVGLSSDDFHLVLVLLVAGVGFRQVPGVPPRQDAQEQAHEEVHRFH